MESSRPTTYYNYLLNLLNLLKFLRPENKDIELKDMNIHGKPLKELKLNYSPKNSTIGDINSSYREQSRKNSKFYDLDPHNLKKPKESTISVSQRKTYDTYDTYDTGKKSKGGFLKKSKKYFGRYTRKIRKK
jgi:hypothetical protein